MIYWRQYDLTLQTELFTVPNENKRPLRKRKKDDEKESVVDKKPVDKSKIPKEPKGIVNLFTPLMR